MVVWRVMSPLPVGRFQVMATLQAARAFVLGLPMDLSLSWGLNRAIFYAAAKRGFKEKAVSPRPKTAIIERPIYEERGVFFLGNEMAYKTEGGDGSYFIIGDKPQTVEDFKKGIEARFKGRFEAAWSEALGIVRSYDRGILLSQRGFFEEVYRPRRDSLAREWSNL